MNIFDINIKEIYKYYMLDGPNPDQTTPSQAEAAPITTPQPASPDLHPPTADASSLESLAGHNADTSAEELATTSAERAKAFRELIPQLANYGYNINPSPRWKELGDPRQNLAPFSILKEPAGKPDRERFIAITEDGAKVVHMPNENVDFLSREDVDIGNSHYIGDPSDGVADLRIVGTKGDSKDTSLYLIRDASEEEAMQALARSVQRADSTRNFTRPAHPDQSEIVNSTMPRGGNLINRVFGMRIARPTVTVDRTPGDQFSTEMWNREDQLRKLRSRYANDQEPKTTRLGFDEAINREIAITKTPNTVARDAERQRVDTAARMTEFLKEPMATI